MIKLPVFLAVMDIHWSKLQTLTDWQKRVLVLKMHLLVSQSAGLAEQRFLQV